MQFNNKSIFIAVYENLTNSVIEIAQKELMKLFH
jgi:hypothetical protein